MRSSFNEAVMAAWAARELPARLDVGETAKLLGFAEHDVQILMASGKLKPLGDPAPNAPKWFAAMDLIRLAADNDWLNKATKEVSKYWRAKRERQQTRPSPRHADRVGLVAMDAEKVSPKASPEPSPSGRWKGNGRAMQSDEQTVGKVA